MSEDFKPVTSTILDVNAGYSEFETSEWVSLSGTHWIVRWRSNTPTLSRWKCWIARKLGLNTVTVTLDYLDIRLKEES